MQRLAEREQAGQTQAGQTQAGQMQAGQMQAGQKQAGQMQAGQKLVWQKPRRHKRFMGDTGVMPGRGMPDELQDSVTPTVFLGRRTLSKLYLMLHYGRMLSMGGPVRLDTVNQGIAAKSVYDYCGIEVHEHPHAESLRLVMDRAGAPDMPYRPDMAADGLAGPMKGCHMLDLSDYGSCGTGGQIFLVTDPDRNSLEEGFDAVRRTASRSPGIRVHRVYLDVCESARIDVRYMETLFARNLSRDIVCGEWLAIAASERDQAAILDNQHDDRLRLSRLSPSYRRLLQALAVLSHDLGGAATRRLLAMADRRR